MGLFNELESRADEVAGKAGVTPEQVRSIVAMVQKQLAAGSSTEKAIEEAARKHNLPVDKVKAVLSHFGGIEALSGGLGTFTGRLFNN